MVRSPWKIISGLMSRRKTADGIGSSSTGEPDIEDRSEVDISPPQKSAEPDTADHAHPSAGTAEIPTRPIDEGDPEPVKGQISAVIQLDPADKPEQSSAIVRKEGTIDAAAMAVSEKNPAPAVRPSNRSDRRRKTEASANDRRAGADAAAAGSLSETDKIRVLDDEISSLRTELAGKLRLQNAQLRRMLKRYEPR